MSDTSSPTATTTPEFRIVARGVVLRRTPVKMPLLPVIRGDVARIDDRFIARFGPPWSAIELPDPSTLPDDDATKDHDWIGGSVGIDWGRAIEAAATSTEPHSRCDQFGPAPETEEERLIRDYPATAARLGVKAPAPPRRLFGPGRVWVERRLRALIDTEDWLRARLADHLAGTWGEYGSYDDHPPTAAQVFMGPLASVETQNLVALRHPGDGRGFRSRFPLDERAAAQAQAKRPAWQHRLRWFCDVVTSTGPTVATLMSLGVEDPGPAS